VVGWLHYIVMLLINAHTQQFYGNYTAQYVLTGSPSYKFEDYVGAKFYCPHASCGSWVCK